MNDIQNLIDRQLGFYCRFNYDNILKRLVVDSEESFYGLQSADLPSAFDQDPPIFACRFSEAPGCEHILALANENGRVAIQDTSTARSARSLHGVQCHNNAVFDLAWMPKNKNFVTVSGDHTACLWDVGEGSPRQVAVFAQHTRSVKTVVFRPTEPSVFATGARDGHVLVWDARAAPSRADNRLAACHSGVPTGASAAPPSHTKRPRIDGHRAVSITGLVFQDDLTLISCGECDGNIKVWDLRKNYSVYKREPLPKHSIPYCGSSAKNGYTNLIVDEARVRLYASCMDDVIYCFNVSTYTGLPERRYVGHENSSFYIKTCLSPDGAYLASGSSDKRAYVWSVRCAEPLVRLAGHRAEVTCAAWGRRGAATLVTAGDDARHYIWRVGPELQPHRAPLAPLAPPAPLAGRAEPAPRRDPADLPQWRAPDEDKTPNSLKRKFTTAPGSSGAKRARSREISARKTKRCLMDLMNASRDADEAEVMVKRLKLDVPSVPEADESEEGGRPPAGVKRHGGGPDGPGALKKRCPMETDTSSDWVYIAPKDGTSFMTPTKNYERKQCKVLSPRSLHTLSSNTEHLSPVKVSPNKLRIITFTTPTKNLPNFVLDGEAPHLRLMSPVKKKQDTTNWLTRIVRERKGKSDATDKHKITAPLSPKENVPSRRNSVTEKTTKSNYKNRTLLQYFSVATKDK